jgi:hypothetical protein
VAERQDIRPRSRRAFGCVTWFYTGTLVLLAVAFLLSVPFRYAGEREVYRVILSIVDLYGFVFFVPGTALAAVLGARTYRTEGRRPRLFGAAGGAVVGWACFFLISWLMNVMGLQEREQLVGSVVFPALRAGPLLYMLIALSLASLVLVLAAVFSRGSFGTRRATLLASAILALVAGLASLVMDPGLLAFAGVAVSTLACAAAGWVMGYGYTRAGGKEAFPPEVASRR